MGATRTHRSFGSNLVCTGLNREHSRPHHTFPVGNGTRRLLAGVHPGVLDAAVDSAAEDWSGGHELLLLGVLRLVVGTNTSWGMKQK